MHNSDVFKVFGPVWGASGVRGFFGEGYWYQKLFVRWIPGYSFESVTFVAKTATANPTVGNMPLAQFGGGGLSGWPLRWHVNKWIRTARTAGIEKHINAGGGIFGPLGVWRAKLAGADSISLGSIAAVRPWMLGPTTAFANWLFNRNINKRRISS